MSHDLKLERLFDAHPDDVFDAFTDPEAQKEWYEDNEGWVVEASCDLRVGGIWDVSFGEAGSTYRETNVFSEIDRPHKVAYVSTFTMPDGSSFDTTLVVTFEESNGKTLMTIVQTGFPNAEERDAHQGGWPGFIDRLEQVVAKRAA